MTTRYQTRRRGEVVLGIWLRALIILFARGLPSPNWSELERQLTVDGFSMSSQAPERRLHPRVPFRAEARLFSGDVDLGRFNVKNISAGGALVIGDTELSFGQHVRVMMTAPQFGSLRLEADVVRVYSYDRGFAAGIAFRPPPLQIAQMIEEVVLSELAALERASQDTGSTT